MVNVLFPALQQNAQCINKKLNVFYKLSFAVFLLIPIKNGEFIGDSNQAASYFLFVYLVYLVLLIAELTLPVMLCKVVIFLFGGENFTTAQYLRVLIPHTILSTYLILIVNICPFDGVKGFLLILIDIWLIVNVFISLRNTLGFTMLNTLIIVLLYGLLIVNSYINPI